MMQQIHDLPSVQAALMLADKTIAFTKATHAAVTSDRAKSIYRIIIKAAVTTVLLSIASVLLLIDGIQAIHKWAQAHAGWQYEDFESAVSTKVHKVAGTVQKWVRGQRDRASDLVQEIAISVEFAARSKVAEVCEAVKRRAIAECSVNGCK